MNFATKNLCIIFYLLFIFHITSKVFAINQLTTLDPQTGRNEPGYIDRATLVLEPHGAYVEQSLYVEYSDHGKFAPGTQVEITHRFELPQGAVVNDLWLWISDSVMKAIITDTWTARAIYDSIVSAKRDPAFLSKKGNQYELHVYPLAPGSFRKIKLNFISPTNWLGDKASAILPFQYLNANNAAVKPLTILFRTQEDIWGEPSVLEMATAEFIPLVDTLNYHFEMCEIEDISHFSGLTLNFEPYFSDSYFYRSYIKENDLSYFQLGIKPGPFFGLRPDTTAHKYLVGLDLSGSYNKNLDFLIPKVRQSLKSAMNEQDQLNLIVVGSGKVQVFSEDWLPSSTIDSFLDEFLSSDLVDSISRNKKPHILYCDHTARRCWGGPGVDELASWERHVRITDCLERFKYADIVAAYKHGHDDSINDNEAELVISVMDTFFNNGGRFLSFYDYNRVGKEKLATHYINGLTTRIKIEGDLYRNIDGNIGKYFPTSVYHHVVNILEYDDPDVVIELMDKEGRPAIISKKIGNGLLVVTGIWSHNDDNALKSQLGVPLLGLNACNEYRQLPQLLDAMQKIHITTPYNRALVFSNSDSLIEEDNASAWITAYLNKFEADLPSFKTINLLDGTSLQPPYVIKDNIDYYGSGYFLKMLADRTNGVHYETHLQSWDYIIAALYPDAIPPISNFTIDILVDNGLNDLIELREINKNWNDGNKPLFFLGSTSGNETMHVDVAADFKTYDSTCTRALNLVIFPETVRSGEILPTMLAAERLNDMFTEGAYDTAAIVRLAVQYNLLCDYTALIALEPNDTLHFLRNPFKEDEMPTQIVTEEILSDSLEFDTYPNPFNDQVAIALNLPEMAEVSVEIYNIRGQLVTTLVKSALFSGRQRIIWQGMNNYRDKVSTGIYFVKAMIHFKERNKTVVRFKRVLLLR